MCGTVRHQDGIIVLDLGGQGHELLIKPFRTLSYCYLVNVVAVQLERYRSVADRNRLRRSASQHHGRRAEAGGKAIQAGARRKYGGISPDIRSNRLVSHADAFVCAGFCDGEDCQPRGTRQQLQWWLCVKFPKRQGSLGWM